ncbi:heavy-metal-associated domain-containing protein [Nocardioides deserti]|nr:heavy-metal-associated domain-containing protein [Nocardioides deserti]
MSSGTSGHGSAAPTAATQHAVPGVTSAQGDYLLAPVTAPGRGAEAGTLSFQVLDGTGDPVTEYATQHDKDLHLIVVRTDGAQFRHVHPRMASDGTWSLPWEWAAAGTYRIYADFVPAAGEGATITLTRTVEVAGELEPVVASPSATATVKGYTVTLGGELTAGQATDLTLTVTKDGEPVTSLEPYLGAFGHLVALREGDLAYLHVHPEGDEPTDGELSGPDVGFMAEAPTPGRYFLYFDFQIDGEVLSAPFVVDAAPGSSAAARHDDSASDTDHAGTDGQSDAGHGH